MAEWMQDSTALWDRPLRHLCILGSHDSGMGVYGASTEFGTQSDTITQYSNVAGQLALGVRFFDLRAVISGNVYATGHYTNTGALGWQGATGESIEDIMTDVVSYTNANQELIILYLSEGLDTDNGYVPFSQGQWDDLLNNMIVGLGSLLFVAPNATTVDLTWLTLRDFIGDQKAAVVVVVDPSAQGITLGNFATLGFYGPINFPIYNVYADTDMPNTMMLDQIGKMITQRPNPDASYFLLSWTLTQQNSDAFPIGGVSVLALAAEANQYLENIFAACCPQIYPNIILFDGINSTSFLDVVLAMNLTLSFDVYYKVAGQNSGFYLQDDGIGSPLQVLTTTTPAPAWIYGFYGGLTPSASPFPMAFFRGTDSHIYLSSGANSADTSAIMLNPAINTTDAPAIVAANGTLYLFYKGLASGADTIWMAQPTQQPFQTEDGMSMTLPAALFAQVGSAWINQPLASTITTSTAPAAALFNGTLYVFYKGSENDGRIWVAQPGSSINEGLLWTTIPLNSAINTATTPAVVVFNHALYLFYTGPDNRIYVAQPDNGNVSDGDGWSANVIDGINSEYAPSAGVGNEALILLYLPLTGTSAPNGITNIYTATPPPGIDVAAGTGWTTEPFVAASAPFPFPTCDGAPGAPSPMTRWTGGVAGEEDQG